MTFYECRNLIVKGETEEKGNLWLGDYESARNKKKLKSDQIFTILTAGLGMKISYTKQFNHKMFPLYDHDAEDIARFFQSSFDFIDHGLTTGNVLVHCFAGVSRSTTLLAAYLMRKNRWGSKQTLSFIKKGRPYIGPNKGFILQLKRFDAQLNKVSEEKMELNTRIIPGKEKQYLKQIKIGKINSAKDEESNFKNRDGSMVKKSENKITTNRSLTVQKQKSR